MPANLPPQYYQAEKTYREVKTAPEKLAALETMLAIMPKHKGTDKLRAELRRRIAKLSEETERKYATGKKGDSYQVDREGAGQAILIGLPNVGKSRLLSAISNASPEVADYPFTTTTLTPGMMEFENVQVQVVDIPPLTDHEPQPWLHNLLRNADLLLLVVDLGREPAPQLQTIFEALNKVRVKPVGQEEEETAPGTILKKALIIGNKNDLDGASANYQRLRAEYDARFPLLSVSAEAGLGLAELKREVYNALGLIRVYTKAPGDKPHLADGASADGASAEPVVLPRGSTVADAAGSVHKDFHNKLKYALVWGSGKFDGQRVSREHVLEEGDVIELHI